MVTTIGGKLTQVHPSGDKFILKDANWFEIDYNVVVVLCEIFLIIIRNI